MKKKSIYFSLLAVASLALFSLSVPKVHATFNQNKLIDDGIFSNANSMSSGQIDSWLNNYFPSSCISTNSGFSSPDPTGYSPSTGFTYGANVSGGQVIYDAAQAYGLNPQVIIATLQKESSVVSGTASYHCQYINTAMGYDCPDSGNCPQNPATESGFSKQVIHAAWLFKFGQQRSQGNTSWDVQLNNFPQTGDHWDNSDDPQTCYGGPMTQGTFKRCSSDANAVFYDGYSTIDNTSVHMDSGGTAALYWYTPHFSGNQNFVNIFESWFGSTVNPCGSDPSNQAVTSHAHINGDYNGDGKTDAAIFRSSDGCWHINGVGDFPYGQAGDIPVPGDYNGDGKTDAAVFRPSDGGWHIRGVGDFPYGQAGDIPVPGDYNGDGKTDAAVYRPSQGGMWHIRGVGDFQWGGWPGDIPVPGDYNGDGKTDIAIYRPINGMWYIRGVGDFQWGGWPGDIPVPGDYNGNGITDIAIYRPQNGGWFVRGVGVFSYGWNGDIPLPGNYTGIGRPGIAVYRPGEGGWHISAVGDFPYGWSTDIPVVNTLNALLLMQYGLIPGY